MKITQCDKCKKQSEPKADPYTPKGWRIIEYRLKQYGSVTKAYHVCPDCAMSLGIPADDKVSLENQFLDILSELAHEAVEEAISNQ